MLQNTSSTKTSLHRSSRSCIQLKASSTCRAAAVQCDMMSAKHILNLSVTCVPSNTYIPTMADHVELHSRTYAK